MKTFTVIIFVHITRYVTCTDAVPPTDLTAGASPQISVSSEQEPPSSRQSDHSAVEMLSKGVGSVITSIKDQVVVPAMNEIKNVVQDEFTKSMKDKVVPVVNEIGTMAKDKLIKSAKDNVVPVMNHMGTMAQAIYQSFMNGNKKENASDEHTSSRNHNDSVPPAALAYESQRTDEKSEDRKKSLHTVMNGNEEENASDEHTSSRNYDDSASPTLANESQRIDEQSEDRKKSLHTLEKKTDHDGKTTDSAMLDLSLDEFIADFRIDDIPMPKDTTDGKPIFHTQAPSNLGAYAETAPLITLDELSDRPAATQSENVSSTNDSVDKITSTPTTQVESSTSTSPEATRHSEHDRCMQQSQQTSISQDEIKKHATPSDKVVSPKQDEFRDCVPQQNKEQTYWDIAVNGFWKAIDFVRGLLP